MSHTLREVSVLCAEGLQCRERSALPENSPGAVKGQKDGQILPLQGTGSNAESCNDTQGLDLNTDFLVRQHCR